MKKMIAVMLMTLMLVSMILPVQAFALYYRDCIIDQYGDDVTPGVVTCNEKSINLRAQPNLNGMILSTLYRGDQAAWWGQTSVDNRGVTWYYVSWQGVRGWVSSRYTSLMYCN